MQRESAASEEKHARVEERFAQQLQELTKQVSYLYTFPAHHGGTESPRLIARNLLVIEHCLSEDGSPVFTLEIRTSNTTPSPAQERSPPR
jgi:hypothetical protein